MNDSMRDRRRFLARVLSFAAASASVAALSVSAGCGEDKSAGPVENAPNPAEVAKDSMNAYQNAHLKNQNKKKK